jgi:hypothetical protein
MDDFEVWIAKEENFLPFDNATDSGREVHHFVVSCPRDERFPGKNESAQALEPTPDDFDNRWGWNPCLDGLGRCATPIYEMRA